MMARWMFGAVLFAGCVGLAALAVEQMLRLWRRPTRAPWIVALVIGACWPLAAPLVLTTPTAVGTVSAGIATPVPQRADPSHPLFTWLVAHVDHLLLAGWWLASLALLTRIVLAVRTLRRIRSEAQRVQVGDDAILVDARLGPAVIGLIRPEIVVPAWIFELEETLRALVLRHEREHCRAHDARLVWLAACCTSLLPFNVALWWISRRLRTAMEVDCDRRTLRHGGDETRYARLLLLIAQRHNTARLLPALSSTASQLTRRIAAMNSAPIRYRTPRVIASATVFGAALVAACSPRLATNLTSPAPQPVTAVATADVAPASAAPTETDATANHGARLLSGGRMPAYPAALRAAGVTGNVLVQYVVNADGTVDESTFKVSRTTVSANAPADAAALFVAAVRESVGQVRYDPARVNGRAVRALVSMPFAFELADAAAKPAPALPYFDFQVEKPATPRAGSKGPLYPQALREAGVQGQVLAQFVVNTDGTVDLGTFKVLKSDHDDFSASVRAALADMRFEAARVDGKAVRQVLQVPFAFSLSR